MIKSVQNETDEEQSEVIIKKKYRAVRKNNNSSPTPLNWFLSLSLSFKITELKVYFFFSYSLFNHTFVQLL